MRRPIDSVPRVISLFFMVLLFSVCVDQATKFFARDRLANQSAQEQSGGIVISVSEAQEGMTVEQLLQDEFPLMTSERARTVAKRYVRSTTGKSYSPKRRVKRGDHVRVMYRHIPLIEDLLVLELHQNTKASFNLGMTRVGLSVKGMGLIGLLLVVASLVALGFMPHRSALVSTGLGLFAGGSLGNAIDRLVHGYVTDFILTPYLPPFNVADLAIGVSSLCVLVHAIRLVNLRRLEPFQQEPS